MKLSSEFEPLPWAGSPYWIASEVIRNNCYGTKADIWSFGSTVLEMANDGRFPYCTETQIRGIV